MEKNIENGKNFVTEGQDDLMEDNTMSNTSSCVNFWEDGYTTPIELRQWYEIPNYTKFRSVGEMQDSDAFFALLFRNEELRNTKSFKELKSMAKKYANECLEAEKDAKSKHNEKYFKDLIQRGFNPVIERSAGLYKEEVETFMEYVHQAEWLQYIEQTAEEIHQVLLSKASSGKPSTYF